MAKGVGTTKTHANVGAKAGIAKGKAYSGKEVMNKEKAPIGKGKAYEGKEVHGEKEDPKVAPRKKVDLGASPRHYLPEGIQGMYK